MPHYEVTVTSVYTYCVEADSEDEATDAAMEDHNFDAQTEAECKLLKDSEVDASKRHSFKYLPMP